MIKAALILDDRSLTRWQQQALEVAASQLDIRVVLSCRNTRNKKSYLRHFLYYVLNFASLRNRLTARTAFEAPAQIIEFDSIYEGNWQRLPQEVVDQLRAHDVDVVIKFGMSLLTIDGALAALPIFSFHHGDPTEFRGRPAGFYELLARRERVGTIVQTISNKLDAGKVWAIAHSKVHHHSYKKTALAFYGNSKHLLLKALIAHRDGRPVDLEPSGPIYRLPGNATVLRFLAMLAWRKLSRLFYGAFYEKRWNIVTFDGIDTPRATRLNVRDGKTPKVAPGYNFYADPFFSADGRRIWLEALNASNGLGEIVELDRSTLELKNVLLKGAHFSYPFPFQESGTEYLLPEVASHSAPYLLRTAGDWAARRPLKGMEGVRLLDGTLLRHGDFHYVFGGLDGSAEDCLNVYFARSLDDVFEPHPLNPVVIDPGRARMAGRFVLTDGKVLRLGQDNGFGYGNGVAVCEVVELSPERYAERVLHTIRFADASGPHTVDTLGGHSVLDYYVDRFSLLAGYRRLVPRLLRRLS